MPRVFALFQETSCRGSKQSSRTIAKCAPWDPDYTCDRESEGARGRVVSSPLATLATRVRFPALPVQRLISRAFPVFDRIGLKKEAGVVYELTDHKGLNNKVRTNDSRK